MRTYLLGVIVSFLVLAPSRMSWADPAVDDGLTRLARAVREFVEEEGGEKAVLVGDFIAPPRLHASGGAGIRHLLSNALRGEEFELRDNAPFQLLGRFTVRDERAHDSDSFESVSLRLTATLLDRDDEELKRFSISIFGNAALQFAGGTAELDPDLNAEDLQERVRDSLNSPQAIIVGNETRSVEDSLFGVEIRTRRGSSSLAKRPDLVDGRSFVELVRGEEYIVRLHNRASFAVAVTLTIDGLEMFSFAQDGTQGSRVVVAQGGHADIPGWYITDQNTDVFEITGYADSAAASVGVPVTSVGTVTASFSAAWEPSANPPPDEATARGHVATGRGRQIDQRYERVKLVFGHVRAVVSVRYDRE